MGDELSKLLFHIILAVYKKPGLTGREISNLLISDDIGTDKREVNQILYSNTANIFWRKVDARLRPSWYLHELLREVLEEYLRRQDDEEQEFIDLDTEESESTAYSTCLQLYPWQFRALEKWEKAGCKGVIEAVTGTGKTRVALAAIEKHLREGWKAAVIVPTIDLQNQWVRVIENDLGRQGHPNIRVGLLGGGRGDTLQNNDVLVATAASACKYYLHVDGFHGLMVADECHHYGASNWARGLEVKFDHRIGLTATYERSDNGLQDYLDPYFNGICYRLGYDEALSERVIANFKIAFIGFSFSREELDKYESVNRQCAKYRNELINDYGVTAEPFGEFMRDVNKLRAGGGGSGTLAARYYLNSFSQRRQLLSNSTHKNNGLAMLAPAIMAAERSIIFTQTKAAAESAVEALEPFRVNIAMLDATMDRYERKNVLIGFEDGNHEVVAAPMLLDEGIDVPAADLAIIVASSRNKRQMIQRMGRVLRKKQDGRIARIAIFYIKGTSEDPKYGAHETYIDLVSDSAKEIRFFDATPNNASSISAYLNEWANE